jgi:hypothetical protein
MHVVCSLVQLPRSDRSMQCASVAAITTILRANTVQLLQQ